MNALDDRLNKPVGVGRPRIFLNVRNVGATSAKHQRDADHKEQNMLCLRHPRSKAPLCLGRLVRISPTGALSTHEAACSVTRSFGIRKSLPVAPDHTAYINQYGSRGRSSSGKALCTCGGTTGLAGAI